MWVLVYIFLNGTEPLAVNAMGPRHSFMTMNECFAAREQLAEKVGGKEGHYPHGKQALCVRTEAKQL